MKNIIIGLLFLCSSSAYADVVVIGHPSNGNQLDKDEVVKLFLGKKSSFPDGNKAVPFYLPPGDSLRGTFDKEVLGKSSSQLKSYWSKLVFTGKGTPPDELSSTADAKSKVASDSAAIAYIDSSEVDDTVKVLFTLK